MKIQLKLEELAMFLIVLLILITHNVPWWIYVLLVLGPDIGMIGYAINSRIGAITYNIFHHKGIALILVALGFYSEYMTMFENMFTGDQILMHPLFYAGIILFGHASMDRIFGYGLKFSDNFQHTHLGWIGKREEGKM